MNTSSPFEQRILNSRFFRKARERAEQIARNPEQIRELLNEARQKANERNKGQAHGQMETLKIFFRMLQAYVRGEYRDISTKSLVTVLAAVAYFLMPFDVIPDFIMGAGMVDDMVVIGWAFKAIRKDIERFSQWEAARNAGTDKSGSGVA